jgi:hypothetical protein
MIEKHERPDGSRFDVRQKALDGKTAEVLGVSSDEVRDGHVPDPYF